MFTLTPRSLVSSLVLVWFSFCWNSIWGAGDSQDYYNQAPTGGYHLLSDLLYGRLDPPLPELDTLQLLHQAGLHKVRHLVFADPVKTRSLNANKMNNPCTCFPVASSIYPQLLMVWLFDWGHSPIWFWSAYMSEMRVDWSHLSEKITSASLFFSSFHRRISFSTSSVQKTVSSTRAKSDQKKLVQTLQNFSKLCQETLSNLGLVSSAS